MNLLTYIDARIRQLQGNPEQDSSLAKLTQLRHQLLSYPGFCPQTDILRLLDGEYVMAFARHLFASADDGCRHDTVCGWLEILRRVTRSAIHLGLLPNIDVYPDVLAELRNQYPPEDRQPAAKRMYSVSVTDTKGEFDRLLLYLSSRQPQDRGSRYALAYLFGLLCYGTEIEDVLTLEAHRSTDGDMVHLSLYGIDVPVSGLLSRIVDQHNKHGYQGRLLFDTLDDDRQTDRNAVLSEVSRGITTYMDRHNLMLFRSHSIMSDWLSIAACNGVSPSCVSRVIHSVFEGIIDRNQYAKDLAEIQRHVKDDKGYLKHYWRVLCSYNQMLKADKLEKKISDMGRMLPHGVRLGNVDCYNPYETVVSRVGGKIMRRSKPVFGRYLFVRCSLADCDTIERYVMGASFIRRPNQSTERATVSDIEMARMMAYMQDYGDYSQLIEMDEWTRQHEDSMSNGQHVRVQDGPYAGYEGIIIEAKSVKHGSKPQKQFIVRITGLPNLAIASNVTAQLSGLSLKPI